jgi:hypothetical protein
VPYLFSTGRYTSPSGPLTPDAIPLWKYHVARLRTAHAHFAALGTAQWGEWVGDDEVWARVKAAIEEKEREGRGDWRVSCG